MYQNPLSRTHCSYFLAMDCTNAIANDAGAASTQAQSPNDVDNTCFCDNGQVSATTAQLPNQAGHACSLAQPVCRLEHALDPLLAITGKPLSRLAGATCV